MNIDVIRKAESILERMDMIINKRFRLGAIDHDKNFSDFILSFKPQDCSCCHDSLSPEEAYWNNGKCTSCEKSDFIKNELLKLNKTEADKVMMLVQFSSSYTNGITYKH